MYCPLQTYFRNKTSINWRMAAIQRSSERCLQRKFRASDVLLNHQNNCFQLMLAPLNLLHMQNEISEGAQVVRVHVFHNILDLNASDREETPGKYVDLAFSFSFSFSLLLSFSLSWGGTPSLALVFLIFSSLLATRSMIVITDLNAQGGLVVKSGETFTTSVSNPLLHPGVQVK